MTQYYSRSDTAYSGSAIFSIPFSYINKNNINVKIIREVSDEETEIDATFTWLNDTQITVTSELQAGDVVSIRRNTPINQKIVTYQNQSMILDEDNLNLSQDQLLNVVQEMYDNNVTFEIKVDGDIGDITTKVNSAINKADTAVSTANSANSKADTALSTANTASTNADNAVTTANNAASTANTANTNANNAVTTANNAASTANTASEKVDDMEEDIEAVIEAAEKINELEEAVDTAVTAASTASTAANTATQKAEEILHALDNITGLPSQTGKGGKYLTTDGTDASWVDLQAADKDINNLTSFGNSRLQYAPCAINKGTIFNSKNNTVSYSENIITCDPCTITTTDGRTKVFNTAASMDVTNQANGSYSIFKNYETGELSLADGLIVSKTEYPIYYSTSIIPKMTSATSPKGSVIVTGSNWYNGGYACWGDNPDNPTPNAGQPVGASGTSTTTYTFDSAVSGKGKFSFYQGANSTASYCAFYLLTAISEHNTQYNFYRANNLTSGLRHDVELNINEKIKAFRCTVTMAGSNEQAGTGYAAFRYYEAINAYWLDTSTTPANLKVNGVINNNLVYIGDCTIEDGDVTALTNRYFNACPYHRDLVDSYQNGSSWYAVYSDGWCEQGGFCNGAGNTDISLLKEYKDTNYIVTLSFNNDLNSEASGTFTGSYLQAYSKLTNKFYSYCAASNSQWGTVWRACGYIN